MTTTSPPSWPTHVTLRCGCWPAARRRARRWTRPCVWSPSRPGSPGEVLVLGDRQRAVHARPRDPGRARDRTPGDRPRPGARRPRRPWCGRSTRSGAPAGSTGPGRGAEPLLVESLEIAAPAAGRPRRRLGAMVNLGSGAGEVRRYDVARRWLEEGRASAPRATSTTTASYATSWLARVELEQGRLGPRRSSWPTAARHGTRPDLAHRGAHRRRPRPRPSWRARRRAPLLDEAWEAARAVRSPAAALAGGGRPRRGGLVRRAARPDSRAGHRDPRPRCAAVPARGPSASSAGGWRARDGAVRTWARRQRRTPP